MAFRQLTLGPAHRDTIEAMEGVAETLAQLGDLARAADMREAALRARAESAGCRDEGTASAAFELHRLLIRLGDERRGREVHSEFLGWLAEADPDELSATLRNVRRSLHQF